LDAGDFRVTTRGADPRAQAAAAATLAIAVIAGILVALEVLRPAHTVDPGARAAIETAIAAAAVVTARFLIEIFDRGRQLRELLLIVAVLAVSLASFSSWAGPLVAGVQRPTAADTVRLSWELIGALALAAAAFVPPKLVLRPLHRHARAATVLGFGALAAGTVLAEVMTVQRGVNPATGSTGAGHFFAVGVQVLSAAVMTVGALGFIARFWRAERGADLLAGASLMLAAAGVQFAAVPAAPADWVSPGDGARLAAFILLLSGVWLRYVNVQRSRTVSAVRLERERVARDLHDGLAQDLACITTQAQRLDCDLGPEHPLMLATRDALAELRAMIADLTAASAPTSEEAVRLVAHDLGRRLDLQVNVRREADAGPEVDGGLDAASRDDLIRATRDAIVNAAVRGEDRHVDLCLSCRAGRLVVRVSDGEPVPELGRPPGVALWERRTRGVARLSSELTRRGARRRPR
jgi:signal transduction histidine kinase